MVGRNTKEKACYETIVPWKGKAEELFCYFVKGFHIIKFRALNLFPHSTDCISERTYASVLLLFDEC